MKAQARRRRIGTAVLTIAAVVVWGGVIRKFVSNPNVPVSGGEPVRGLGIGERKGVNASPVSPPPPPRRFTDEELDRAIAEFDSRCRTRAASSGGYVARHAVAGPAYCSCLLIALAEGQPRQQADATCERIAQAAGGASEEAGARGLSAEQREQQTARIMAEARSVEAEFSRMHSQQEMDAWVGPEGIAMDFRDVERSVWRYVGKRVRFRGRVTYVRESPGEVLMQANVCRNGRDCLLTAWQQLTGRTHTRIRERDWIWIYGLVLDEYEYTSEAGWDMSTPRVAMVGGLISR